MIFINIDVDYRKLGVEETLKRTINVVKTNNHKYASEIRDMAKDEFYKLTHNTQYGRVTPLAQRSPASLAEHGLVVTERGGDKMVGPKKGNVYKSTYDKIFRYIEYGVDIGRPWTFELPQHRQSASADGFWTVQRLEPRPFMERTMKKLDGPEGQALFEKTFKKDIDRALRGG